MKIKRISIPLSTGIFHLEMPDEYTEKEWKDVMAFVRNMLPETVTVIKELSRKQVRKLFNPTPQEG